MQLTGQRVLAFGTAGAQGSGLAPALIAHGAVPVRATSRPERAEQWRTAGEQVVVADLADTAAVLAAVDESGAVGVAGHLPVAMGPAMAAAVGSYLAIRERGLPVTVNTGTPTPPEGAFDPFGARPTMQALLAAGVTVLTPTGYLENHAAPWSTPRIAAGELIYPRPASDALAWTAAADMGSAAAAALAHDITGEVLALAGPQLLTFEELAAELGAGLGTPLRFVRVSPVEYGEAMRPFLGDQAADGVAAAYGSMPEERNPAFDPPEAAANWQRLGVTPTSARDWASQVLAPALSAGSAR